MNNNYFDNMYYTDNTYNKVKYPNTMIDTTVQAMSGYYYTDSTGPVLDTGGVTLDSNNKKLDKIEQLCEKTELLYNKLEKLLDINSKKHNSISYKGFYFVEDTENKSYSILDFDLNLLSKYHDSLDSCKEYIDNYEQLPNIL